MVFSNVAGSMDINIFKRMRGNGRSGREEGRRKRNREEDKARYKTEIHKMYVNKGDSEPGKRTAQSGKRKKS